MSKLSRREFSARILALTSALVVDHVAAESASSPKASEISPEEWMSAWMSVIKPVGGALYLSRFRDPVYFLTQSISWRPDVSKPREAALKPVIVPKGFVTDFASIPRIFWSALRPDGDYAYAAIVHDYLYWQQAGARDDADLTLRFAIEDLNVGDTTVMAIYAAVRLGGGQAWQTNAELKARGERRVLRRFPEDPRVTWENWKKEPDVFGDV